MDFREIRLSRKTTQNAKLHELTPLEMAYVDLVTAGWNRHDAYFLVFRQGWNWAERDLDDKIAEIHEKSGYTSRRKVVREQFAKNTVNSASAAAIASAGTADASVITKDTMIKELVMARDAMKTGSKEWIDVQKMISDILRLKQEETKADDELVHFYMPMKCHDCPLMEKFKSEDKDSVL